MTVVPHRTENFPPAPAGSLRAIGTREQRMEACLGHILESEGVPPFAEHARELLARSMDPDGASSQLARVILKDLGLTSQILRVANSSLYNRSGKPIVSVAHAITMLGWNTVRDMVSAMRFVEHYARHSAGLRELMMLSVLSATHGRLVASAVEYAKPEEAYVCGLFRNLGEVLMAQYYAPEYAEMVALLDKALAVIPIDNLWVNPDCGLKTRGWPETELALRRMVAAAREIRRRVEHPADDRAQRRAQDGGKHQDAAHRYSLGRREGAVEHGHADWRHQAAARALQHTEGHKLLQAA